MTTMLFLHGWGGNAASWEPVAAYFRTHYQVLIPELPCPPETVYTLEDYARDVWQFLQTHHVNQCIVVAHSFGARLVALLNAHHPTLFTKIIITGGAGLRPRFNWRVWWRVRWYRLRKKFRPNLQGGSPDYRDLTPNGKITFQNIIHRDLTPEIKTIRVPLLLIHGQKDQATPQWMARRWQRLVPHAQLKIYANQGHFAYLTSQARFINDVREFCDA